MANSVTIKGESGGAIGVGTTSPTSGSLTVDKSSFSTPAVDLKTSGTSFGQLTLTDTNNLSIGCTTSNHTGITFGSTYLPRYNGSNNNGDVDIGAASFRYKDLYLAGGVVFDAVTGSATSNTLDDYEEGLWDATLTPQTSGSISLDGSNNNCQYTKIGKMVFLSGMISVDSVSSPVGVLRMGGLPFAVANLNDSAGRTLATINIQAGAIPPNNYGMWFSEGDNFGSIYNFTDSEQPQSGAANNFSSNESIYFSVIYRTS